MSAVAHARPPLGLPPGSIRGIMAIQIVLVFWILLLLPTPADSEKAIPIPLNLYFMIALVMIFFVSHGKSIAKRGDTSLASPLWLPSGTLRFLILAGTAAVFAFLIMKHPDHLNRLTPSPEQVTVAWKFYFGALMIGFVLGLLVKILPFRHGWLFQSFQAWSAIIAMAFLFLDMIFQVFINETLPKPIEALPWGTALTGVVAFYYGSRS